MIMVLGVLGGGVYWGKMVVMVNDMFGFIR